MAAWTHAGIVRVLERHGRSLEGADDTPHEGASEEPVLAACYAASASHMELLGAAPGRKTDKLVRPVRVVPSADEPLAEVGGVNVHAKVAVGARDHPRRERLCPYLLRPPLAQDRLTLEPDGRVRLGFKAAWKDGTHAVVLDPLDLIARLCALVPPPPFASLAMRTENAIICCATTACSPPTRACAPRSCRDASRRAHPRSCRSSSRARLRSSLRRLLRDILGRGSFGECSSDERTTAGAGQVSAPVRITHPFHPQSGHELDVVVRRAHWGEERVFYRTTQGHIASLPARWTSLAAEEPITLPGCETARFRVADLLALADAVSAERTRPSGGGVK